MHGNDVTCLHATNKTTNYSLANDITAGVFVAYLETPACIAKAIAVFIEWNESRSQYGMIDCCQAEISAIQNILPESKIMLCNFHHEQAWERWVKRKENDTPPGEKDALLNHLGRVAN